MKKITDTVASTLSPSKHVGNHTRLIQQKLIENSATKWQEKDVVAKASEERKKEISNLVNHWEKLSSSSSVENNSEVVSFILILIHHQRLWKTVNDHPIFNFSIFMVPNFVCS